MATKKQLVKKRTTLGKVSMKEEIADAYKRRAVARITTDEKIDANFARAKKGILIGGGVLILGVGGYFLVSKIVKAIKSKQNENNLKKVLDDQTKVNTANLKISDTQALDYANRLYTAMASTGTDTSIIEQIFLKSGLTTDDLKLIVKKFGIKDYGIFGSPTGLTNWFGLTEKLDLMGWLHKELSDSWLNKIRPLFSAAGFTL